MSIPETAAAAIVAALAAALGWALWRALVRAGEILAVALAYRIVYHLLDDPAVMDHIAAEVIHRLDLPDPRPPERG